MLVWCLFFKQKAAYEMRISDWSSDVCSSDLHDEPDHAMLMGAALWGVIHQAHTEEIGDLAEQILLRWPDTTNPLLADVAATAATCRYMLGDDDSAIRLATEMLDAAERSPYAGATLRRAIAQAQRASGEIGRAHV